MKTEKTIYTSCGLGRFGNRSSYRAGFELQNGGTESFSVQESNHEENEDYDSNNGERQSPTGRFRSAHREERERERESLL